MTRLAEGTRVRVARCIPLPEWALEIWPGEPGEKGDICSGCAAIGMTGTLEEVEPGRGRVRPTAWVRLDETPDVQSPFDPEELEAI